MEKIILFLFACFAVIGTANAQTTAIYVCPKTGAWAYTFDDGKPPASTLQQLKDAAYYECKNAGGTDCTYFYSADCRGCWLSFIMGIDGYNVNYLAAWSTSSQLETEQKVRDDYRKNGGVAYSSAKVTSWYVPYKQ